MSLLVSGLIMLVAAAASTRTARGTPGALTRFVDVVDIATGDRIPIKRHDGVGDVIPLVGLDPRLDTARRQQSQRANNK